MGRKCRWILAYPLAPITYPIICILYALGYLKAPSNDWAAEPVVVHSQLTRYAIYPTKPLPTPRPRRLTLPLRPWREGDLITQQKTQGQAQSLLYFKLPVEIRMLIYELALGGDGRIIHIVRPVKDHLSHVRCTDPDGKCKDYACFQWWTPGPRPRAGGQHGTFNKTHGGLLPLVLSCRRIYTEAITILYSANTFEFRHEINFIYFPPTILPTRMSAIRSLQFRLKISGMLTENSALAYRDRRPTGAPEGALAWKMLWAVVTDMSALRVLNVELEMGSRLDVYTGREIDELLTPLMDVRQTERFVVVIGWVVVGDYRMRELSEKPFEIVEVDPGVG